MRPLSPDQTWDDASRAARDTLLGGSSRWCLLSSSAPASPRLPPPAQTWDDASRAAWDSWMNARAYAGGSWKDAQRQAEHYWRDTKGGHLCCTEMRAALP